VIWIKVPPPVFDLAGVLYSSLTLTVLLAASAGVLGGALGACLIRRRNAQALAEPPLLALNARPERT
jgi:hypothetical protein